MMLQVFEILFALCAVISSLFFVFVHLGWRRMFHRLPGSSSSSSVSIIIAAHNAAESLPTLLNALRLQSYPKDRMQIVIVDDRSTDRTTEVILDHSDGLPIESIRIDSTPDGISPKKWALHLGIQHAKHDIMLLTDADCIPQIEWVAAMLRTFDRANDVVLGLAPLDALHGFASRYAAFESRRTMALMTGAAGWRLPYMACGRSWGFMREAYDRSGGLEPVFSHLGGDDDLLLQQLVLSGACVGVCMEAGSRVHSSAPASWKALYHQKLRHYRVSGSYRGRASVLLAVFVITESLTPVFGILLALLLSGPAFLIPLLVLLWKFWYDTGFLLAPLRWMKGETARMRLALLEGFHIFFAGLVGLISFIKQPHW